MNNRIEEISNQSGQISTNDSDDVVIRLKGVSKKYNLYNKKIDRMKEGLHPLGKKFHRDFYALKDLDLEVRRGEVLGIVGLNGSGKSTLLKIISNVLTPTSGIVNVFGQVMALLQLGSGFSPEFTGRENIFFMGSLLGISSEKMKEKEDEIIRFADIGEHIDQPLKTYSSGMKARLAFSLNTEVNPEILVLDEILSVGDAQFKRKAFERMERLINDENTTVLFVSHDHTNILRICQRAILLSHGELIADSNPKEVIDIYHGYLYTEEEKKKEYLEKTKKHKRTGKSVDNWETSFNDYNSIMSDKINLVSNKILDENNNETSILYHDKKYFFNVEYRTLEEMRNVVFGWILRDKKGLVLNGISFPSKTESIKHISGKQNVKLIIEFHPKLMSDEYLIDIGVSTLNDDERVYEFLKRDSIKFKIVSDDSFWGLVNQVSNCELMIGEVIE